MAQPTLLLLHSPLVGPLTWQPTATRLRARGHHVVVPPLTVDGGPPYYRKYAEAARTPDAEGPVVLVAHSGAGALLPSVAELVPGVRGAVFVDALLPHPGRSWFDTAPADLREQLAALVSAGRLPRWNEWFPPGVFDELVPDANLRQRFFAELTAPPVAYFEEPAPDAPGLPGGRCAYVRLSEGYDDPAAEAGRRGWWVHREDADHLAPLTRPGLVADVLIRAVTAVTGG